MKIQYIFHIFLANDYRKENIFNLQRSCQNNNRYGAIQKLRGQDEGGGGLKMSVFVHAQGMKTVHAGGEGGVKKWQNSVHVVVEWSLILLESVDGVIHIFKKC